MAFLTLNDMEISVQNDNAGSEVNDLGHMGRSFSGKVLAVRRRVYESWNVSTTFMLPEDAIALKGLLKEPGHVWSFDDSTDYLYSTRGLYVTLGTLANANFQATTIKFGDGSLEVDAGTYVQFNVGFDFDWTAMVWEGSPASHYIVNSDGQKWVDGVRNDAASTPFITMVSGNFRLGDTGSVGTQSFDDLVLVPYIISPNFCETFGVATVAFSPLPLIRATGSLVYDYTYHVICTEFSLNYTQGYKDGTWYSNLAVCEFTLEEDEQTS